MSLDLFNLIIISGVIQGLIFTTVILINEKYRSNTSRYIAYVVLFLSLSNLQYWFIENNIINTLYIFVPWQWLIMPMFYVFVSKFLSKHRIKFLSSILLFSPFFLIIILHIAQVYLASTTLYKMSSHYEHGFFLYLDYCSFIFNFTIIFLVYRKIKRFQKKQRQNGSNNKAQTDWLIRLLYIGFFICIFWLIALTITLYLNEAIKSLFYILWLSISFLVYWLGYAAVYQLKIYKERVNINSRKSVNTEKKISKKQTSVLAKIIEVIEKEELFLNPNLRQSQVSEKLEITANYISKILNEEKNINFNDYINQLRVKRARELLLDKEFDNYTNIAIGLESGFNSKSTFFKAFKKHTGLSPTVFKRTKSK